MHLFISERELNRAAEYYCCLFGLKDEAELMEVLKAVKGARECALGAPTIPPNTPPPPAQTPPSEDDLAVRRAIRRTR